MHPLYVAVYVGVSEGDDRPLLASSPGIFFSGLPPMGAAYTLEERLKPISSYLKTLVELHLVNRMQRERDFARKTIHLVKSKDLVPLLPNLLPVGLKTAQDRGWVTEGTVERHRGFRGEVRPAASQRGGSAGAQPSLGPASHPPSARRLAKPSGNVKKRLNSVLLSLFELRVLREGGVPPVRLQLLRGSILLRPPAS